MSLESIPYRTLPTRASQTVLPLCSVVIPAFRAGKTLAQTLDSIRAQTLSDWETIVIIDGLYPDDSTLQIAQSYAAQDFRFKIIVNPRNHGAALARNVGVAQARAPWIAFLDSDDRFYPQKLEQQLAVAKKTQSRFLCSFYNITTATGSAIRLVKASIRITRADLIRRNVIGCSTVMLRRDLALKYPMCGDVTHEDYLCWLECLQECDCITCEEVLTDIQKLPGSRNSNKWRSARGVWEIYRDHLNLSIPETLSTMTIYGVIRIREILKDALTR